MGEKIYEELKRLGDVLHFFGRHHLGNRLIDMAVVLEEHNIATVAHLVAYFLQADCDRAECAGVEAPNIRMSDARVEELLEIMRTHDG